MANKALIKNGAIAAGIIISAITAGLTVSSLYDDTLGDNAKNDISMMVADRTAIETCDFIIVSADRPNLRNIVKLGKYGKYGIYQARLQGSICAKRDKIKGYAGDTIK